MVAPKRAVLLFTVVFAVRIFLLNMSKLGLMVLLNRGWCSLCLKNVLFAAETWNAEE